MSMKWKALVWAFILVVVVVYLFIEAGSETAIEAVTLQGYTAMSKPSFWPQMILVGLLVTCSLKLFLSIRKSHDQQPKKNMFKYIFVPKVMISVCLVALYCYLSQYLGFAFATMAFTASYMWFMGMRKLKILISLPIITTLFILLVFWRLLYLAVPKGEGIFLTFSNAIMGIVRVGI